MHTMQMHTMQNCQKNFKKLINDVKNIDIMITIGPMTETLYLLNKKVTMKNIYIMGGALSVNDDKTCRANIFDNQFNFMTDMTSAREFLKKYNTSNIVFFPTETMKRWVCKTSNPPITYETPFTLDYNNLANDELKNLFESYYSTYIENQLKFTPSTNGYSVYDLAPIMYLLQKEKEKDYNFFNLTTCYYDNKQSEFIRLYTEYNKKDTDLKNLYKIGQVALPNVKKVDNTYITYPNYTVDNGLLFSEMTNKFTALLQTYGIYKTTSTQTTQTESDQSPKKSQQKQYRLMYN